MTTTGDDDSSEMNPTMQRAVGSGCQQYIQYITVCASGFRGDQPWSRQSLSSAAFLRGCGGLPALKSVTFSIYPDLGDHDRKAASVRAYNRRASSTVDEFAAIVDALVQKAPGVAEVEINVESEYDDDDYYSDSYDDINLNVAEVLVEKAYALVGAQTRVLKLHGLYSATKMPVPLPADSLKRIAVSKTCLESHGIELIRRNSGTLQRLMIATCCGETFARLVVSDKDPSAAIVYPALERLCIAEVARDDPDDPYYYRHYNDRETDEKWSRDQAAFKLTTNPFPSLEVFEMYGRMSFPTSFVLAQNRAQLRRLSIELRAGVSDMLHRIVAAGEGGFTSLERFAVWLDPRTRAAEAAVVSQLPGVIGLCGGARDVRIKGIDEVLDDRTFRHIDLSASVLRLTIESFDLTLDQAMAVFCASPQLRMARIRLVDEPESTSKAGLTQRAVREAMDRYSGCASSLTDLALCGVMYSNRSRRATDHVLLLACLLPRVANVFKPVGKVSRHISQGLSRPPFKHMPRLSRLSGTPGSSSSSSGSSGSSGSTGRGGWRGHLDKFRDRPASHVTAFAVLHEVTAVAPLAAVYYALDYIGPPVAVPEGVLQEANRYINKLRQYAGWEPLAADSPVLAHLAASYAVVKAAAPLRIALCLALTPAAARWCVVPVARALERARRWMARK
ncbi:hypothetical protein H4R18_000991 [Coemansia javaensis]|uniref:Uncharacterized protein n=1 Tax=Coemansia javaensis TaxID=2761396 RepID=A0A9W8HGH3_9FUNG|nr:hypothetical protein H4R18_000991 [Coemansia javaensis]